MHQTTNHLGNHWNPNQFEFSLTEDKLTYTNQRATHRIICRRIKALILVIFKGLDYFHRKWNSMKRIEIRKTDPKFNEIIQEAISKGWKRPISSSAGSSHGLTIVTEGPDDPKRRPRPSQPASLSASQSSSASQNNRGHSSLSPTPSPSGKKEPIAVPKEPAAASFQLTTHTAQRKSEKDSESKGASFSKDFAQGKLMGIFQGEHSSKVSHFAKEIFPNAFETFLKKEKGDVWTAFHQAIQFTAAQIPKDRPKWMDRVHMTICFIDKQNRLFTYNVGNLCQASVYRREVVEHRAYGGNVWGWKHTPLSSRQPTQTTLYNLLPKDLVIITSGCADPYDYDTREIVGQTNEGDVKLENITEQIVQSAEDRFKKNHQPFGDVTAIATFLQLRRR